MGFLLVIKKKGRLQIKPLKFEGIWILQPEVYQHLDFTF